MIMPLFWFIVSSNIIQLLDKYFSIKEQWNSNAMFFITLEPLHFSDWKWHIQIYP